MSEECWENRSKQENSSTAWKLCGYWLGTPTVQPESSGFHPSLAHCWPGCVGKSPGLPLALLGSDTEDPALGELCEDQELCIRLLAQTG